jgi:hypothetical protein
VPAKPLPIVVPVISTSCPGVKCLAENMNPTGSAFSGVIWNSARYFFGEILFLRKWPISGLVNLLRLTDEQPTYIDETPSFSNVLTCVTWQC